MILLIIVAVLLQLSCVKSSLDAVIVSAGKDTRVFEKSIVSALKHLVDVRNYYVICPNAKKIEDHMEYVIATEINRVKFIDERDFPFDIHSVSEFMLKTVREKGLYPLNKGKSDFELVLEVKAGWYFQQLLKFYAGSVLKLGNYVLLDSDIVWFNDIKFLKEHQDNSSTYYYATSRQYHFPYISTIKHISGLEVKWTPKYRSGICHHMVFVKEVLDDLINTCETLHNRTPFWQVLLNQSALELTKNAPRPTLLSTSSLSEYELYFQFALQRHPNTVSLRPLLWANGPAPGLIFWPEPAKLDSDATKRHWIRSIFGDDANFDKTILADKSQGYDYIGYHSYAKRRYFDLAAADIGDLCQGVPTPVNGSTCSYHGMPSSMLSSSSSLVKDWFKGCACYMAKHKQ